MARSTRNSLKAVLEETQKNLEGPETEEGKGTNALIASTSKVTQETDAETATDDHSDSSVTLSLTSLDDNHNSNTLIRADKEEDLDDDGIFELLNSAKNHLNSTTRSTLENDISDLKTIKNSVKYLPKLSDSKLATVDISEPGKKQKGPVKLQNESITQEASSSSTFRTVSDPVKVAAQAKAERDSHAGSKWFNMPKTEITPGIKRDLQLLQMRSVLDPKRHYKKDSLKTPTYFQMGTIIEGNTEYYSARLEKKDRKKTIAEEILADAEAKKYFKRKYGEIQNTKTSGRKAHYNKVKQMRKNF